MTLSPVVARILRTKLDTNFTTVATLSRKYLSSKMKKSSHVPAEDFYTLLGAVCELYSVVDGLERELAK